MISIVIRSTIKKAVKMPSFVILKIQKEARTSPGV